MLGIIFINAFRHPVSILSIKELSDGYTILNVLPYYNAQIGYAHLDSYTNEAILIYKFVLMYDLFVLIPLYLLFLILGMAYFRHKIFAGNNKFIAFICFIPVMAAFLNIAEDAVVYILLKALPSHMDVLMTISGILTTFKSLLISVCLFFMLYCVIRLVLNSKNVQKKVYIDNL